MAYKECPSILSGWVWRVKQGSKFVVNEKEEQTVSLSFTKWVLNPLPNAFCLFSFFHPLHRHLYFLCLFHSGRKDGTKYKKGRGGNLEWLEAEKHKSFDVLFLRFPSLPVGWGICEG